MGTPSYAKWTTALDVSKKRKVLLGAIVVSITVAAAFFFLKRNEAFDLSLVKTEAARIGLLAPDFELKDLNGRSVRLADFRGKNPIFLNFWASRKFVDQFKFSFVSLLDSRQKVLDLYGGAAIPTTFLIDRKGIIVAKEIGPRNWTSPERLKRLEQLFN